MTTSEYKAAVESILHLNGCQQRTKGWNEAKAGEEIDMDDVERLEETTLNEILQATKEYVEERERLARIDELEKLWEMGVEHGIDNRIMELKQPKKEK